MTGGKFLNLAGFLLKLDSKRKCTDRPRRMVRSLTRVWLSKVSLSLTPPWVAVAHGGGRACCPSGWLSHTASWSRVKFWGPCPPPALGRPSKPALHVHLRPDAPGKHPRRDSQHGKEGLSSPPIHSAFKTVHGLSYLKIFPRESCLNVHQLWVTFLLLRSTFRPPQFLESLTLQKHTHTGCFLRCGYLCLECLSPTFQSSKLPLILQDLTNMTPFQWRLPWFPWAEFGIISWAFWNLGCTSPQVLTTG